MTPMEEAIWSDPGALFDDLPDDLRGWIESELVPGERILWAARPIPCPLPRGWRLVAPILPVAVLLGPSGFCLGTYFGAFGQGFVNPARELLAFGLITVLLGISGLIGVPATWIEARAERDEAAVEFYTLTDRRAVIWRPDTAEAVEIHSIHRGEVGYVSRDLAADGSGSSSFYDLNSAVERGRSSTSSGSPMSVASRTWPGAPSSDPPRSAGGRVMTATMTAPGVAEAEQRLDLTGISWGQYVTISDALPDWRGPADDLPRREADLLGHIAPARLVR